MRTRPPAVAGPAHRVAFPGLAASGAAFETPLGPVPFLKQVCPSARIVPRLAGDYGAAAVA